MEEPKKEVKKYGGPKVRCGIKQNKPKDDMIKITNKPTKPIDDEEKK